MSWKVMVHGKGDPVGHLSGNALRFRTQREAEAYGDDLYSRWMGMDRFEIKRSADPVNYVADKYGRARPISANILVPKSAEIEGSYRHRPAHPHSRGERKGILARLTRRAGRRRYRGR